MDLPFDLEEQHWRRLAVARRDAEQRYRERSAMLDAIANLLAVEDLKSARERGRGGGGPISFTLRGSDEAARAQCLRFLEQFAEADYQLWRLAIGLAEAEDGRDLWGEILLAVETMERAYCFVVAAFAAADARRMQ